MDREWNRSVSDYDGAVDAGLFENGGLFLRGCAIAADFRVFRFSALDS